MTCVEREALVRAGLVAAKQYLMTVGQHGWAMALDLRLDPAAIAATVPESDELAALRRDAERYRWLRRDWLEMRSNLSDRERIANANTESDIDAAIDAAMATSTSADD